MDLNKCGHSEPTWAKDLSSLLIVGLGGGCRRVYNKNTEDRRDDSNLADRFYGVEVCIRTSGLMQAADVDALNNGWH